VERPVHGGLVELDLDAVRRRAELVQGSPRFSIMACASAGIGSSNVALALASPLARTLPAIVPMRTGAPSPAVMAHANEYVPWETTTDVG
jgi:hypothetical protein